MPALAPKPVEAVAKIAIKVPEAVHELVTAYAAHLGGASDADYIYAEAAKGLITRDKEFMAAHNGSNGRPADAVSTASTPTKPPPRRASGRDGAAASA